MQTWYNNYIRKQIKMIIKESTLARWSSIGHYGIQYPNTEAVGIVVPTGAQLQPLSWIGNQDYQAFSWDRDGGTAVVWIEKVRLK